MSARPATAADTRQMLEAPHAALARLLGRLAYQAHRLLGHARHDRAVLEWVHGAPLLVLPGVFNPRRMRTGAWFAGLLDGQLIGSDTTVLDLGTGSGIGALFAARHARQVLALDINPAAVNCARANALMHRVADRVEVCHSDLFAAAGARRFDLVLFNPPFLAGPPASDHDRAWRSVDVPERFAAQLHRHLRPGGQALLLLSSFGGAHRYLAALARHGCAAQPFAARHYYNERLVALSVRPAAAAPAP